MSLTTNPVALRVRGFLRRAGLTQGLSCLLYGGGSEDAFSRALRTAVRPGDVIWDVGANVGLYTPSMADWVGPDGKVFAFEPSRQNLERLRSACAPHSNITVFPFGLSSTTQRVRFLQGGDRTGATSRVLGEHETPASAAERVELRAGDDLIGRGEAVVPNVAKIDVEGHEYEVLEGMRQTLQDPRLRDLFIEVHFALLAKEKRTDVPSAIERRLRGLGFKTQWTDPSHIHAAKG